MDLLTQLYQIQYPELKSVWDWNTSQLNMMRLKSELKVNGTQTLTYIEDIIQTMGRKLDDNFNAPLEPPPSDNS